MKTIIGANIYIDGVKHNATPIPVQETAYDISDVKNPGDTFDIQSSWVFDDDTESVLTKIQTFALNINIQMIYSNEVKLTAGVDTSTNGFYYFLPYLSSDLSLFNSEKKYLFFYSTDHDNGPGGLYVGQGDKLDLSDFQELGLIKEGSQAETPYVIQIPASESGLPNDEVFIYYHTNSSESGNTGQETRLMTTVGGDLPHLCIYTDRGRPLGVETDENHTGYLKVYKVAANNYIGLHIGRGGLPQPWKRSVSTDGLNFTREADIDTTSGLPDNYFFKPAEGTYINYKNTQFWIGVMEPDNSTPSGGVPIRELVLCKSDGVDYDSVIIQKIISPDKIRVAQAYITNNLAHIYYTKVTSEMYYAKFHFSLLDNLLTKPVYIEQVRPSSIAPGETLDLEISCENATKDIEITPTNCILNSWNRDKYNKIIVNITANGNEGDLIQLAIDNGQVVNVDIETKTNITNYLYDVEPFEVAYALEKLHKDAQYAIKIRRTSDDEETNVGFDVNDVVSLDSPVSAGGDLRTWIGSNDAFVSKRYNQASVFNFHQIQNDFDKQPKFIVNGSIINQDGSNFIEFDGVDDSLVTERASDFASTNYSILSYNRNKNFSKFGPLLISDMSGGDRLFIFRTGTSGRFEFLAFNSSASVSQVNSSSISPNTNYLVTAIRNSTDIKLIVDGVEDAVSTAPSNYPTVSQKLGIGDVILGSPNAYSGFVNISVLFKRDITDNMESIETVLKLS